MNKKILQAFIFILACFIFSNIVVVADDADFDGNLILGDKLMKSPEGGSGVVLSENEVMVLRWWDKPRNQYLVKIKNNSVGNNISLSNEPTGIGYGDLCAYKNDLYYIYSIEEGDKNHLKILINFDDEENNIITSNQTIGPEPTSIVYKNKIMIFFTEKSENGPEQLKFIRYDGENWSKPEFITSVNHIYSIYTIEYGNKIHLFYTNWDPNYGRSVYWTHSISENNFTEPERLSLGEDHQHVKNVFVHHDKIYCIWDSQNKDKIEGRSYDGSSWSEKTELKGASSQSKFDGMKGKMFISYHHVDEGERDKLTVGKFDDFEISDKRMLKFTNDISDQSTGIKDDKIWIFYDDGEYIRYITYDGESFDYAEAIGGEDGETNIIVRYWWIIALAGIVAILLSVYGYRKK